MVQLGHKWEALSLKLEPIPLQQITSLIGNSIAKLEATTMYITVQLLSWKLAFQMHFQSIDTSDLLIYKLLDQEINHSLSKFG